MDNTLTVLFFKDYFICTVLSNKKALEVIRVNGNDKILLYFFVRDGIVRNDEDAKVRFEANDNDAFGDFYGTLLTNDKTFIRNNLVLPPIELLHEVIVQLKVSYFDKIKSFSVQVDTSGEIPLNICFIPEIDAKVKESVRKYFENHDFIIKETADFQELLRGSIQRKFILKNATPFAIVESYSGHIQFYYVDTHRKITKQPALESWRGYQIKRLARLMIDYLLKMSSGGYSKNENLEWYEKDIQACIPIAEAAIDNFEFDVLTIPKGKVKLSNEVTKKITIDKRDLEAGKERFFIQIKDEFKLFINRHSFDKVFLSGEDIDSKEFIRIFSGEFGAKTAPIKSNEFIKLLAEEVFEMYPNKESENIPLSQQKPNIPKAEPAIENPKTEIKAPETNWRAEPAKVEETPVAASVGEIALPDKVEVLNDQAPVIKESPGKKIVPIEVPVDIKKQAIPKQEPTAPIKPDEPAVKFTKPNKKWLLISAVLIFLVIGIVFVFKSYHGKKPSTLKKPLIAIKTPAQLKLLADTLNIKGHNLYNKKNYQDALREFTQSASIAGNVNSEYMLGFMYHNSQGIKRNDSVAITWFKRAADQNDEWSKYFLGIFYFHNSEGAPQNLNLARQYFDWEVENGKDKGCIHTAKKYLNRIKKME